MPEVSYKFWEAFVHMRWQWSINRYLVASLILISLLDLPLGKGIGKELKYKSELPALPVLWIDSQKQVERRMVKKCFSALFALFLYRIIVNWAANWQLNWDVFHFIYICLYTKLNFMSSYRQ